MRLQDLPKAAWTEVIRWTALLTLVSVAISLLATHLIMSTLSNGLNGPGIAAAVLMPILLGVPICLCHLVRLQQLKIANERLDALASTDWLTACLNRRAFTDSVTALLEAGTPGALLIIDADHFKAVNDAYGHQKGDEALQLIADVIRAQVRAGDLVCRMGGEEFGVFLAGADSDTAALIAERIRRGIGAIRFTPNGTEHALSASTGGVAFTGRPGFEDLFRAADRRLYEAKQCGRNCIRIGTAETPDAPAAPPVLRLVEAR